MDTLDKFEIDLINMAPDVATYQFVVDDAFFGDVSMEVVHGGHVDVTLQVSRKKGYYELLFGLKGCVTVVCDRCLGDLTLPVDTEDSRKVKHGDDYGDDGDFMVLPFDVETVSVAKFIYDIIILHLPLKTVHEDGGCDESMMKILGNYSVEEFDRQTEENENPDDETDRPTDPRWDELKKILDNN